jgi:4-amino-4-deoxy-L-arabinose transferase-like glycosyltransferase
VSQRRIAVTELLTVAGFCAFLFYFGLSAFGLVGADEPRYAQIAREMLKRGDLVTPTLYSTPWLEKPPLYYWLAMRAYAALGVSDWAARLPSAAAATFMVVAIYFFLRRFRPGSQLNGALMSAASVGVIGFARGAGTDMLLAAAFTIGMLAWFAWCAGERQLWLIFFYLLIGVAMLAKGPVAPLLAGLIIGIFARLQRDTRLIARTLWLPGILLFLAVCLPWYVAVGLRNPHFWRVFILEHNLARFATNPYHHKQPFWYFIPVLLLGVMPWTALVIAGWAEMSKHHREPSVPREGVLPEFLVIWTVVVVVFFSISASKLPGYILPALAACTMIAADWVNRREKLGWAVIVAQGALSAVLLALALLYPNLLVHRRSIPTEARWLTVGIAALVFLATLITLGRRGKAGLRPAVLCPVILGLALLLRSAPAIDNALSARPVAREITRMESRPVEVAVFEVSRETEFGLAFYRNRPVPRYERGEVPAGDHLVVAPEAYADELAERLRPRRVSRLGAFTPQRLELFWVSMPPAMPMNPRQ